MSLITVNPSSFTNPDPGLGGSAVSGASNTGCTNSTVDAAGVQTRSCLWTGFPAGPPKSGATLKADYSATGVVDSGTNTYALEYSLNGGGSWSSLFTVADLDSSTSATASAALTAGQDLTAVRVRLKLHADTNSANLTGNVSNIKIEIQAYDPQPVVLW